MHSLLGKGVFAATVVGLVLMACGGQFGAVGAGSPLAAALGDVACPELKGDAMNASFTADAQANATIRAFVSAAGDFAETAQQLELEVRGSCERIANDLGAPIQRQGDENATAAACSAALAKIDAILSAGASGKIRANVTAPQCNVNAQTEAACKGQCRATVDPGAVKANCAPGQLSGRCDGTCSGQCSGTCNGECAGTCQGQGSSGGRCAGQCNGTCKGTCGGECKGSCSVELKEPKCNVDARAPRADATCEGSCKARADITAQCTPAKVDIQAAANVGELPKLVATLERNLPSLVKAQVAYGQRIAGDVDVLVRTGTELPNAMGRVSSKAGACLAAAANATVAAQASLRVSVQASANINAKVGASR